MSDINFDTLPCEIKRMIFDFNRKDASIKKKQKKQNKKRYEMVVGDIKAQLDNLEGVELGMAPDYDEHGREIDEIIRPREVLKMKQGYKNVIKGLSNGSDYTEDSFFRFYNQYYPHINYDEFVVRFRQAIQ